MNTNKSRASALLFIFLNGAQASVPCTPMWVNPGAADLHVLVKCRDGWVAEKATVIAKLKSKINCRKARRKMYEA